MKRLAILVTCYNRAAITRAGLSSLIKCIPSTVEWRIFAVDDGSTDDTAAVLAGFGERVEVIHGTGQLYWAGGMREAEKHARRWAPDFYLWFNDDAILDQSEVTALLRAAIEATTDQVVWIGSVQDALGKVIYGPLEALKGHPLGFVIAHEAETVVTFNGNFVLIPRAVVGMIGGIPEGYRHGYADLVYGVRCTRAGVRLRSWNRPVGVGQMNPARGRIFDAHVPLFRRVKLALSPFGLPIRNQLRYSYEMTGARAPYWFARSYFRVIKPLPGTDATPGE